jgi:hypothetical protein
VRRPLAARLRSSGLGWHGGPTTSATGAQMTIYVSDRYASDQVDPQGWADFFAGLVHGAELSALVAYVATPDEVTQLCGPAALACAGGGRIVIPGETDGSVASTAVATHEYAHFVALHRVNPPWTTTAFGTKRWATVTGVCARAARGTAFPGDEGDHYRLNPGESFAEAYRILNETKTGATAFSWPIVDPSFYPDANALAAVELDVLSPWQAPTVAFVGGRFLPRGARTWRRAIAAPLDGVLGATLTVPAGGLYELTLSTSDGRTKLATGLWSGAHTKALSAVVCGQRHLVLTVTRRGAAGRFSIRLATP